LFDINRNMSNKSLFEKLFEEVMENDAQALGIGGDEEGGMGGGEEGGMGGDEAGSEDVTISMDRETAQKLHDLLASVLGGDEVADEEMAGEGGEGGEGGEMGEEDGEYGMGDEAAEECEEGEEEEPIKESPQSGYVPFNNKGESLQKKSNQVQGAIAGKVSGAGKPEKTAQTQGTAHYMPFNQKPDHATGSQVVKSKMTKASGAGESMFQAK
jgi:hypothetical protein